MGIIVLLAAVLSKEPFKQRLGLLPQSGRRLSRLRVATLAAFTVSLALASLIVTSLILGAAPNTPIGTAVNSGSWGTITLVSVLVSLLPAIVEELLFRGYIQRRLLERWSPALSIGVTTLLFAILHADSLQHILAVVPLGVVTGIVAYRTKSVKPGMLLHVLHNTGAIGLGAIVRVLTPFIGDEGVGMLMMGAILVLAIIGLPAMVSLLRSASADRLAAASVAPQPAVDALAG
jgi:membrane protease YdiL (CAAX protease family)